MTEFIQSYLPLMGTLVGVFIILWASHWLLIGRHSGLGNEEKFTRQLMMLAITLFGLLTIVMVLPVRDESRNNLLGLLGILISGIIAFSSTTIFANLAAGILLRITKPFRTGDFIRITDHFGRVTERGLFDTEIQTETRELVSLPNAFVLSNPVTTIRSSGTIISANLSLGYDIEHHQIETLLIDAAIKADLAEPFVHIIELGNYSVSYRVSGFLAEPKLLISARSKLYGSVLDTLHAKKIEIMSPSYMMQKRLDENQRAIPSHVLHQNKQTHSGSVETIAFDKAEKAEEQEKQKLMLCTELENLKSAQKMAQGDQERSEMEERISFIQQRLKEIDKMKDEPDSGSLPE